MPETERNMLSASSIVSSAGADALSVPEAALSDAAGGVPVRHANPDLTSASDPRVYNRPAAQPPSRPAA